jgi:hypothetical protein
VNPYKESTMSKNKNDPQIVSIDEAASIPSEAFEPLPPEPEPEPAAPPTTYTRVGHQSQVETIDRATGEVLDRTLPSAADE